MLPVNVKNTAYNVLIVVPVQLCKQNSPEDCNVNGQLKDPIIDYRSEYYLARMRKTNFIGINRKSKTFTNANTRINLIYRFMRW